MKQKDSKQPKRTLQDLLDEQQEQEWLMAKKRQPPVDLNSLTEKEKQRLQDHPIYKDISSAYNVQQVFNEWFGRFDELEKTDVWKRMPQKDQEWARQAEIDRLAGVVRADAPRTRAFDDPTDEENMNYLAQELRHISKPNPQPSENSMSSGDGDYEAQAAKIDLSSDDEDLARIKVLTSERANKQQVQIDLDRIHRHQAHGRSQHANSAEKIELKKQDRPDYLTAEKIAVRATLETGRLDLYARAMQINEKQAKHIVALAQNEKPEAKAEDDILSQVTEDEEFNYEMKNLAQGNFNLAPTNNIKAFDPDESYFSEDEEELDKDEIKRWQKTTHDDKFTKGSFLTQTEAWLMNSGYQTRETKKADRLTLGPINPKVTSKAYNAKDIIKRMKKAGVKQSLAVTVAQNEINELEKQQSNYGLIANQLQNKTEDGKDKYTEKNRLFRRNLDEGKLYTDRYVRRLKVAHSKLLDKFTMGSKYALRAQKKQIMSRATRLVVDSHNKLLEQFQNQAMVLLHQTTKYKDELTIKTNFCDKLLITNRALEIDLSLILRQNDYMEQRIPKIMQTSKGYKRPDLPAMESQTNEYEISVAEENLCKTDLVESRPRAFKWENLSVDARCKRAVIRAHIIADLEDMEPNFTQHAFDFYGTYARISESQKFKYAESKLINFYKGMLVEVLESNEKLKSEVDNMIEINKKYEFNEDEVKEAIQLEKEKRELLTQQMETQKELYEKQIADIVGSRHEEKLDITDFYTKQIEFLNTEIETSKTIREILIKNNEKLKKEIETLAKVIRTSRNHFKELEKCDLEALNNQLEKYESKIAKLQMPESQVESIRAEKAKKRLIESQKKAGREEYNKIAKQHRFSELAQPIDEKAPKKALKQLWDEKRPKKIHERLPVKDEGISLEDVLVQKRNQALKYLDAQISMKSEAQVNLQPALNEDSLTEPSIETDTKEDIFKTAHTSEHQKKEISTSMRSANSMGERLKITKRNNSSGKDGYEPFKESKEDLQSEKEMLIGSVTDDINDYLKDKLNSSNQDLIEHDQILISEHGTDLDVKSRAKKRQKRDNIKLASQQISKKQFGQHKRSRTQLKQNNFPAMMVSDQELDPADLKTKHVPQKEKPWQQEYFANHTLKANLEVSIAQQSKNRGKTAERFTVTADSSKNTTDRMLATTTPHSGRIKNFSIGDDSFGQDSITRLQTANHLIGMPRRDPLKHKIIPKMQGVMGGEKAQQALAVLDNVVQASTRGPMNQKLPKLNDARITNTFKRRAASIPPKTAAASLKNSLVSPSGSNNQPILQSLVNNNAFLGRGKFSNRGNLIAATVSNTTNLPMSPPSIIQVKGTANVLQQQPQQTRGSKVRVKLPGTTTASIQNAAKQNIESLHNFNQELVMMISREQETFASRASKASIYLKKPTTTRQETMDINELVVQHDDTAFSISKLNLPSSAGNNDDLGVQSVDDVDVDGPKAVIIASQDLLDQGRKDTETESNTSHVHKSVFSRLDGTKLTAKIDNPTDDDSIDQSKQSSRLQAMAAQELLNISGYGPDSQERHDEGDLERQYLSMTPLMTIEIRTDTLEVGKEGKGQKQSQPGKAAAAAGKRIGAAGQRSPAGSKSPAKKTQRPAHQPLKKKQVKLVSPVKNQERIEKEKKQNKLKSQLDNAASSSKKQQ